MIFLLDFLDFVIIGALISLTIRWLSLQYRAYQLKSAQRGPLDRMICISSKDILKGVIRKRALKGGSIVQNATKQNDIIDKQLETILDSVYESLSEQNLTFYLIPNEDMYIANKRGMLSDSSKLYLNDEIIVRLSDREKKEIIRMNEEKKKKEKEKQEFREWLNAEQQKRLKEKEVEDQINI